MPLLELLSEIDRLKAEVDALRPIDKELEQRIMQKFRLDWNYHSNHIEGNSLTYGETKTFLLHGLTAQGKPLKDHLDIKGHNEGIRALEDIVKNNRPLTETFIRQLHEVILPEPYESPAITADGLPTTKKITPGKYKTLPNHVETVTKEIFYFATPEETPAKMGDLMKWYNTVIEDPNTHPLIVAAEFHYRFVRIHPFDDGNGRMARLLMNLVLMSKGFPPVIIKTEKKQDYYRALQQGDGGNVEAFVEYIGEQLIWSLNLFEKGAKGENIDEEDDIDKQIKLLKLQLKNNESLKTQKNETAVNVVLYNSFIPLCESVLKKVEEFKEYFFESQTFLFVDGNSGVVIEDLEKSIRELRIVASLQQSRDYKYYLNIRLNGFKNNATNPFSVHADLTLTFDNYTYSIEFNKGNNAPHGILVKSYDDQLSINEMKNITNETILSIVDIIKKRTNIQS